MELQCENLTKQYGHLLALSSFQCTIGAGIYGILGPNGAGKTTLMQLLTDNLTPTAGIIRWDGEDIRALGAAYRAHIGYMPQQQGFFAHLSAYAFLTYMAQIKGITRRRYREEIVQLLDTVHLTDAAHRKIGTFSGGMRQRVLLAQALLGSPSLLVLDEPTAGLDPYERIHFRNLLTELSANRIILLSTHIVGDVECIADRVWILRAGHLLAEGEPGTLLDTMYGHVFERYCEKNELPAWQKAYPMGIVSQSESGMRLRITGDAPPDGFNVCETGFTLEDVYLYTQNLFAPTAANP